MDKKIIYLLICLILTSFSSAIKISPTQTKMNIDQYESVCTNVWILPQENYSVTSKWSINGRGEIEKYYLKKEDIQMNISYSKKSEGKYEICFTPKNAGNFSGIIYFYSQKDGIEIGSWFDIVVNKVELSKKISTITGNIIKNQKNNLNLMLSISPLFLTIFLILILRKTTKNKKTEINNPT